jgi:dTDP-4-amino-4,6-dideoxygalactose transaminase
MSVREPDIPLSRPVMDEAEAEAARRAILSGWVTQGPEVARFEEAFAAAVGAPHACAVSSGTAALHLALEAAGVGSGDEVVTVSHSFIATTSSIRYTGALPVFVDIEPATFNIDPARVAAAITPRTKAILCVHQLGLPCDLAALLVIARRHGLALVEDAACAIGSEIHLDDGWQRVGRPHGDIACFSFHPRKVLTTGDGGMITTRHAAWDAEVRRRRQHGMSLDAHRRHTAAHVAGESYVDLAYNYRMTDIQAAIGQVQLSRLPAIVSERRRLAARYARLLDGIDVGVPAEPASARSNWQGYCVRLPADVDQAAVMQAMRDRGVATRLAVMCAHREPACPPGTWRNAGPLVESERARDTGIQLPLFPGLSDVDQERVVSALAGAIVLAREGAA